MEKQFTIRLKPYEGESLSSFMLRFAYENGVNFLFFWNAMRKSRNKYCQMRYLYLLNYTPLNVIDYTKFSYKTGLNQESVFKLTLYNVLKKFSINDNLVRARFLNGMIRDEIFFYCPECLKEKAYHRLTWMIEDIKGCHVHKTSLRNSCPHCRSTLKYKDLREISLCPYCAGNLAESKEMYKLNDDEYKKQLWIYESWNQLMNPNEQKYNAQSLALKALYILNKKNLLFDRYLVSRNMKNSKMLPTLLQHARGTLVQERTIHLQFILSIAYSNNISLQDFLNHELPQSFLDSILLKPDTKQETPCCKAAWCNNYNRLDSLIKIATSFQRKNDGNFKSFYFICPECGCEYVYDIEGSITERTRFIEGYQLLKDLSLDSMELKDLCVSTGVQKERMRRYIAYFSSNLILKPIRRYAKVQIDKMLLEKFIIDIKQGDNIEDIKNKGYWNDNFHYLIHRYNNKVLQAVAVAHSRRHLNHNPEDNLEIVRDVLDKMYKNNIKITIANVCKNLGIGHETIRAWECNRIIASMKKLQKNKL